MTTIRPCYFVLIWLSMILSAGFKHFWLAVVSLGFLACYSILWDIAVTLEKRTS